MKKIAILLAVLMLTLSAASCSFISGEKTFTVDSLSITVKGMFTEQNELSEEYDLVLISPEAGVMILQETYDVLEGAGLKSDMTVKEYAEIVMKGNSFAGSPVEEDGLTYFTYTATNEGTEFTYTVYCFRGGDAYWMVQIYCATSDYESMKADITAWAKSVTFS